MPTVFRFLVALFILTGGTVWADDVLFIGNSFTFADQAPVIQQHGGVPKLFEAIARAKGHDVTAYAVTAPGKPWAYHLAQPRTKEMFDSRAWTWVVLQDYSTRPTRIDDVKQFLADGMTFSRWIAGKSPHGGIVLYETWARPPGAFYAQPPGNAFPNPAAMLDDLHHNYGQLRDLLAKGNPGRPARIALVGTAFARCKAEHPEIILDAKDAHHASPAGYYLAALVMDATMYHESVLGAPATFFDDAQVFSANEAAAMQTVADEVTR